MCSDCASALQEFFPAALVAFDDLAGGDALELLAKAADPATAARLTRTQIVAALRRAGRRQVAERAERIQTALRIEQLHPAASRDCCLRRHRPQPGRSADHTEHRGRDHAG